MSVNLMAERRVIVAQQDRPPLGAPPEALVEEDDVLPVASAQTAVQKIVAFAAAYFKVLVDALRLLISALVAWKPSITVQRLAIFQGIPRE